MRLKFAALLAAAFAVPAMAQPAPPKLVVMISVDQLSADLFDRYRPTFTGGLKRLGEGASFAKAYQSHNATETCPGHSTLLTGARPARNGIVANDWFDFSAARADKKVYCAEDERVAGSTSENYTVSNYHLMVPALGDLMKRKWTASRTVSVAGKDRAAVMMGGKAPDQYWYWKGSGYTGAARGGQTPKSVAAVNQVVAASLAEGKPPMERPQRCDAVSQPIALAGGKTVGDGRFARTAGNVSAFRASPEFDATTLALAAALRAELKLGEGAAPDLLIVGLSATDYVGHTFGPGGGEMCIQLESLDRDLGDFLARMDATGIDYAVALSADHGGLDIPERTRTPGAARVDAALSPRAMGPALATRLGLPAPAIYGDGSFGDMYVNPAYNVADRKRALDAAIAAYRAHSQVEAVFTAEQIRAAKMPTGPADRWTLIEKVRASYYPGRSGDFLVLLKPNITPIADPSRGSVATHGSPWDYDRRVPILFWRKGLAANAPAEAIETVDIMPTLGSLLGLTIPAGSVDGRCRDIVAGPGNNCL